MAKKTSKRKYTHVNAPTRIPYYLTAARYNKIADYVNEKQEIISNYTFQSFFNESTDLLLNSTGSLPYQNNTQIEEMRQNFNELLLLIKEKEKSMALLSNIASEVQNCNYQEDLELEREILDLLPLTYPSLCKRLKNYEKQDIFQALMHLEHKSEIFLNPETMKWCNNNG